MISKEVTEEYFSTVAGGTAVECRNSDKYEAVQALLLPSDGYRDILECGGGEGFYTHRLLQDGYAVTSIDLSAQALRQNLESAKLIGEESSLITIQGDFLSEARNLGEEFDQVVFIKVLHHLLSLQEIYEALDIAQQVLRSGGRIVVFEPNGSNPLWHPFLAVKRDPASGKSKWFMEQNLRLTTVENLEAYLESEGVSYQVRHHYVIPSFILNTDFWGASMLRRLNAALEKIAPTRMSFNFSIVIDT